MTETQRDPLTTGPYRRQPPTIDVVPEIAAAPAGHGGAATQSAGEEPATAIEPMAATGLDPVPADTPKPDEIASLHHGHLDAAGSGVAQSEAGQEPIHDPVHGPTAAVSGHDAPTERLSEEPDRPIDRADRVEPRVVPSVSATSPAPMPPRRAGFGALATTGLLGGLIGAALATGAEFYLHPPVRDVDARLAALESRPRPAPAPDLAPLDRRLGTLEAQSRDLGTRVAAVSAAAAEAKPVVAAAAPVDPALRQDLGTVQSRVDALETALKAAPTPEALNEIRTKLDALGTSGEERLRAGAAAVTALQATTAALDQRVKTQGDELGRLPPALMAAGLRAIVAEAIGDDLRAGTPLRPALAALERLGTGAPDLDALRPFADKAAPSIAALIAEFKPIADRITAEPAGADASFGDRLKRMADKLVSVRAVGDGSGTDLPGLVGRIETALNRADLSGAAATADRLPDSAKREASDWIARLKARAAADASAARIKATALAALDKTSR